MVMVQTFEIPLLFILHLMFNSSIRIMNSIQYLYSLRRHSSLTRQLQEAFFIICACTTYHS